MEIKKSIENLTKYVEIDKKYRKTDDDKSDFDKFCDEHINDIEILLKYVEELDKKFQYAVPDEIVSKEYIHKSKLKGLLK